jgi:hypothetical protein
MVGCACGEFYKVVCTKHGNDRRAPCGIVLTSAEVQEGKKPDNLTETAQARSHFFCSLLIFVMVCEGCLVKECRLWEHDLGTPCSLNEAAGH